MIKKHTFLIFLSFVMAILVAFSNAYVVNLKGAEVDAERFLKHAMEWAQFGSLELVIDAEFFIQFLGVLVYLGGSDELFLTAIGILFYYCSIWFLLRQYGSFGCWRILAFLVACYLVFFSPSLILRMGALLREPYVIFALIMMTYHAVKFIERKSFGRFILVLLFGLIGALFHKAFLAFLPIFLIVLASFLVNRNPRSWLLIGGVFVSFGVLAILLFPTLATLRGGDALSVIMSGDFSTADRIVDSKSSREFRTTYDYGKDFSSLGGVLLTVIQANIYYYLAPFPSKVTAVVDIFAVVENWLRIFVITYLAWRLKVQPNRAAMFVLVCYFLFNSIWAVGTSNYGTATRHHITTAPLLLYGFILVSGTRRRQLPPVLGSVPSARNGASPRPIGF